MVLTCARAPAALAGMLQVNYCYDGTLRAYFASRHVYGKGECIKKSYLIPQSARLCEAGSGGDCAVISQGVAYLLEVYETET